MRTLLSLAPGVGWLAFLAVWTVMLLTPNPAGRLADELSAEEQFTLAKSLHVVAYLGLTLTGLWAFRAARPTRWAVPLGLVLHGAVTEYGQTLVPTRFGSVRDVLLDAAGVLLGVWVARAVFRPPGPAAEG
jgi:VanZ family protein